MKRWMKRSIAVVCSLLMVIGMTACGKEAKKDDEFRTPKLFDSITKKTGLHMDFEIEDEETKMDFYTKKDSLYMDYEIDGEKGIIISDGKLMTVLDPATKTGEQAEIDDSTKESIDQLSVSVDKIYELAADDGEWTKGTAKQNGMEYESEEVENDGDTTKFLYNDDDELVYIISKDDDDKEVIKVNAFDDKVPDDIFDIPDDYTIGGGDSNPEPQPKTDTSGTGTKTPTGSYKEFADTTHGFKFEVDNAFATKLDGETMNVYTGKEGAFPMFKHFIMQNSSGQTDEQLLTAVGNDIVKREGSNLVKGPITNKFNANGRTIKGLEWITNSNGKQLVQMEYVEQIQTFFHIWTASYYSGDTVTPAALEHAIETFEMLAG